MLHMLIYSKQQLVSKSLPTRHFQVIICCIAPPISHIINNQELCRRVFGGKMCWNIPSTPSGHSETERRRSAPTHKKNATEPTDYTNLTSSVWRNQFLEKRFERLHEKIQQSGTENRAFTYEVRLSSML